MDSIKWGIQVTDSPPCKIRDIIIFRGGVGGLSPTVDATAQGKLILKQGTVRRLTPLECERLQGFSDGFTKYGKKDGKRVSISDSQRYKMLGNAVTTNVVRYLVQKIDEVLR